LLSFHNTPNHLTIQKALVASKHKARYREPVWKDVKQQQEISKDYKNWLLDSGSLTAKLIKKSGGDFHVSVLKQSICPILLSEKHILNTPHRQWAMVREVVLYGNNIAWVYARTIVPLSTLQGPLRRLHYLGAKPLGDQLFTDPSMEREEIQVAQFALSHIPHEIISQQPNHQLWEATWGRRSVFRLSSQPLLVSEIFLPSLIDKN
jgi:chorismate lyase